MIEYQQVYLFGFSAQIVYLVGQSNGWDYIVDVFTRDAKNDLESQMWWNMVWRRK